MKILEPSYYKNFKCIADKCKNTCCIGWRITIDKTNYEKYNEIKGEFGDRLNSNIRRISNGENNANYGEFILDNNMKCPMLNGDNLCDIYINKGPDYLCFVCAAYPRSVTIYGDIAERNLTLSCPSVAQILVDKKEKIDFILNDEIKSNGNKFASNISQKNDKFHDLVRKGRSISIDVAQFSEIPMWKRLAIIKLMGDRLQSKINNDDVCNVDEFINDLRSEMFSESLINSLDDLEKADNIIKSNLISMIFETLNKCGMKNKHFAKMETEIKELLDDIKDIEISLNYKEDQFNIYFKNREYILENYIVYNLYTTYMKCLINDKIDIDIFTLMISYFIIKLFLLAIWDKNDKMLTDNQIVEVLYNTTREIEHSEIFIQSIYDEMKKKGVNTLITMIY